MEERQRKLVHHQCGHPLWAEVLACMGDRVVVSYRNAAQGAVPVVVFVCPGCDGVLKLWWDAPTGMPDHYEVVVARLREELAGEEMG